MNFAKVGFKLPRAAETQKKCDGQVESNLLKDSPVTAPFAENKGEFLLIKVKRIIEK